MDVATHGQRSEERAPELITPAGVRMAAGARSSRASRMAAVRVLLDAVTLAAAGGIAFVARFRWHVLELTRDAPFDAAAHLLVGALWLAAVVGAMASERLYDEDTLGSEGERRRVVRALLLGVAVVSVGVFLLRLVTVSRGWFGLVAAGSFVCLALERSVVAAAVRALRRRGRLRRSAVLVTGSDTTVEPSIGEFDIVLRVDPRALPSFVRELGGPHGWGAAPPAVIVDEAAVQDDELWRLVLRAGELRAPVYVRSAVRSVARDRLTTRELDGRTIVKVAPPALAGMRALQKRALDVVVAATLLTLLAVPIALIALLIVTTSGRPILYGQQRVGRGGRTFTMWKFRSMRTDAEEVSGPMWAAVGDPRCTPVGRWLRKLSLDELPQLWNVLRGDMSVVGPRPERPLFVAEFSQGFMWYRYRHRIRPGVTGLAQVRGLRGDTPLGPRVDSDNWYIEHWSLGLDVRIMLRTAVEVVRGRNAG